MSTKPIIYSGESIPALIRGDKMMTRRLRGLREINESPDAWSVEIVEGSNFWFESRRKGVLLKAPYAVGDVLWVREAWKYWDWNEGRFPWIAYKHGEPKFCGSLRGETDGAVTKAWAARDNKWRSPLHMFREFSRLTIPRVLEVRAERVQEISWRDLVAEGCQCPGPTEAHREKYGPCDKTGHARAIFRDLWNGLHAKRGYGWDANPWVWVIRHERAIVENVDAYLRRAAA